jgi:transcriptional regulator with XRE-family HTH domain
MRRKRESPLGKRMREAAEKAGLSSDAVGERLGLTGAAVRYWWRGDTEPSFDLITKYADVVGGSSYELITGKPDPSRLMTSLYAAQKLLRVARDKGEDTAAAMARILENEDIFLPEDRQRLNEESEELQLWFSSLDESEWIQLDVNQQQLVKDLVRMLGHQRQQSRDPPAQD